MAAGISLSIIIGYMLGGINPAFILSKIKRVDMLQSGTGNLGTTNAFIHFGKGWGLFVLAFDMGKAITAVKLCEWWFPGMMLTGIAAGCFAVIGHMFPVYTNFRGGKGVASFGGFILAMNWKYFLILLVIGCVLAFVFNYGCSISFSAAVLFPIIMTFQMRLVGVFVLLTACSGCIIYKHMDNIGKIREGKEVPIRVFLKKYIFKRG